MAHSDALIFLTSITWIFFLFLFIYFFFVVFFLPSFYKKFRARGLVQDFFRHPVRLEVRNASVVVVWLGSITGEFFRTVASFFNWINVSFFLGKGFRLIGLFNGFRFGYRSFSNKIQLRKYISN
jgi:hypothetical protein